MRKLVTVGLENQVAQNGTKHGWANLTGLARQSASTGVERGNLLLDFVQRLAQGLSVALVSRGFEPAQEVGAGEQQTLTFALRFLFVVCGLRPARRSISIFGFDLCFDRLTFPAPSHTSIIKAIFLKSRIPGGFGPGQEYKGERFVIGQFAIGN